MSRTACAGAVAASSIVATSTDDIVNFIVVVSLNVRS